MSQNNIWKEGFIPEVMFFQEGPGVRNTQFRDSGVKLLNVGNINNGVLDLNSTKTHLSNEEANGKYSHFLVDEGDLLIACSGILVDNFHNKIAFANKEHLPLCLNTSTMRFKVLDKNKIDINFFRFYLQSKYFIKQLQKLITGSAQLNFGPSHIKKIKIIYPPLPEQKKIAAILDAADELRQKDKALLEKYNQLTQALFLDMFGDIMINNKGFECVRFENVCEELFLGLTSKVEYVETGGFPLVRASDISGGSLDLSNVKYISESQHRKVTSRRITKKGDVLISKSGSLGTCALVNTDREFSTYESLFTVRTNSKMNNIFLLFLIRNQSFQERLLGGKVGAGVAHLNLNMLRELEFPLPPLNLQEKYAERVQAIESQKVQAEASVQKSEELFNSLLQRAFKMN
jgi:type I restriction enzyme S subunit